MNTMIAKRICYGLKAKGFIPENLIEVYIYGFELLVSTIISAAIILTIGIILKMTLCSVLFLLTFITIRRFTGGYHANKYIICQICTVGAFLLVLAASYYVYLNVYMSLSVIIIGETVIWLFGPIENKHKPMTDREKRKNKLRGLITYPAFGIFGMFLQIYSPIAGNTVECTLIIIISWMLLPLLGRRLKGNV